MIMAGDGSASLLDVGGHELEVTRPPCYVLFALASIPTSFRSPHVTRAGRLKGHTPQTSLQIGFWMWLRLCHWDASFSDKGSAEASSADVAADGMLHCLVRSLLGVRQWGTWWLSSNSFKMNSKCDCESKNPAVPQSLLKHIFTAL